MVDAPAPQRSPRASAGHFDSTLAIRLGKMVACAYDMSAVPPKYDTLPDGYEIYADIWMDDPTIEGGKVRSHYGFLARPTNGPSGPFKEHVMAIRGTLTFNEWIGNLESLMLVPLVDPFKTPFLGLGQVGEGFQDIYQTMDVVPRAPGAASPAKEAPTEAVAKTIGGVGSFAEKVARVVRDQNPASKSVGEAPTVMQVTGHSLGSALTTLYVIDNLYTQTQPLSDFYTFASPRVGNGDFATAFDAKATEHGLTSWRIANDIDVVPTLPPEAFGFRHVQALCGLIVGSNVASWWLTCDHSLATYINILDPSYPLVAGCTSPFYSSTTAPASTASA